MWEITRVGSLLAVTLTACGGGAGGGNDPVAAQDERSWSNRWSAPERLPPPINLGSGWIDQPWISPGGERLYFVYYDCGGIGPKRPGAQGFFDIYVTEKQPAGGWSVPIALPGHINSFINEAAAVEALGGAQLFFTTQDLEEAKKSRLRRELRIARRRPDGSWGTPASLGPLVNAAGMQQDTPSLTADGKTLYFMRNQVTEAGVEPDTGMHIYSTTRTDTSCDTCWSAPQMLPPPVTGEREIQPMIRPNGRTLYFSGHDQGKLLLFVTHKNDDGTWTAPAPLLDLHDPSAIGEGAASLTDDGMTIYFGRAYPTGVGGDNCQAVRFELFTARRQMP